MDDQTLAQIIAKVGSPLYQKTDPDPFLQELTKYLQQRSLPPPPPAPPQENYPTFGPMMHVGPAMYT